MPAIDFLRPLIYPRNIHTRTRLYTVLTVLTNVAGNSALTEGMRRIGDPGNSPPALIAALFHPWVALGVALLILWTITHMALLSWADLSYVMPVTAIGYVVTAFSSRFLLGETVSVMRWTGIALITAGVTLVGKTEVDSRRSEPPQP